MKIFYDWEFLDDGKTIAPISLGMVAEDGRELYLINQDAPLEDILEHEWLLANVAPYLPFARKNGYIRVRTLDKDYPEPYWDVNDARYADHVRPLDAFRDEVRAFLDASQPVELWGYYAAYDHVALAQLFGAMVDRPYAMPMFTHDLMQLLGHIGAGRGGLPAPPANAHNALADARWTRDAYASLAQRFEGQPWAVVQ